MLLDQCNCYVLTTNLGLILIQYNTRVLQLTYRIPDPSLSVDLTDVTYAPGLASSEIDEKYSN